MKIVIFGGGMQGCVAARNLLARQEKPTVIIADIREPAVLPKGAKFSQCNVLNAVEVATLVKDVDAVILAVPSQISYEALKNLISTGVAIVDVSFTPDPPLDLHELATNTGSCCVVDCGVAPGLSHLLVGAAYAELGGLDQAKILVGGIPQQPPKTFKHAVYFNPHDLLAEYIRPARARKNKQDIAPPPLDVPVEIYHDPELGKLEAFLSDGLRSILTSFPDVPDLAELTLRWPEHLTAMQSLREMGLLDESGALSSVASTFGERYPASAYPDVLVMVVEARRGEKYMGWRLIDKRLNDESAMSRTTAYTTAAMAMALARKQFVKPGIYVPENIGSYGNLVDVIIADLRQNGINLAVLEKTTSI